MSGVIQSRSGPLGDIEGLFQIIPGTYKSEKPFTVTGIDEVHLKCDCNNGSILNGVQQPILYSFALLKPPGHKIYKEPRIKVFEKINKPVLSSFYLEDDDHKPVVFNGEAIIFNC